jgi:hypothetical protein
MSNQEFGERRRGGREEELRLGRGGKMGGKEGGREGEATYVVETGRSPAEGVKEGVLCVCAC